MSTMGFLFILAWEQFQFHFDIFLFEVPFNLVSLLHECKPFSLSGSEYIFLSGNSFRVDAVLHMQSPKVVCFDCPLVSSASTVWRHVN